MVATPSVKLTPAQRSLLIEAALYYETVLEDESRQRDIDVLNRAIAAIR